MTAKILIILCNHLILLAFFQSITRNKAKNKAKIGKNHLKSNGYEKV